MSIQCKKRVYSGERGDSGGHPCSRNAKDGMDGYCALHYPPNVQARAAALENKWRAEREIRYARLAKDDLRKQGEEEAVLLLRVAIANQSIDSQWLQDATAAVKKADVK